MKYFFLFSLLLLFSPALFATVVKGKVTDEKGHPLGFSAVFVQGTQNGVVADEQGNYELSVAPGNYILVCRFTAYRLEKKTITAYGDTLKVNFSLHPEQLTIQDVTIHANAEDPANAIMRKVIAERKYHENLIKTRETDVYLKGNIHIIHFNTFLGKKVDDSTATSLGLDSAHNGIIYLLEELSHYTYQSPDKEFNKVLSVRQSGDPHGLGFATMPPILNIYRNNIDLMWVNTRGFISPANSDAFHYYKFHYLGSFRQYGRTIDKIQVTPKRLLEPCFTGIVYVVEGDWVFHNVNLFVTKLAQITGIDTIRLTQTFQPLKKDLWIIQNQVLSIRMRILGIKFGGSFLTVYRNQKINQPVNGKLFSGKVIAAYDSAANKRDSSYWTRIRPVPLSEKERKNFQSKDSSYLAEKMESDSWKKNPHYSLDFLTFLFGNPHLSYKNNQWSMRPLATAVQFNSVEGLSGTLDLKWKHRFIKDSSATMTLSWLNRYGFHNGYFNSLAHWGMIFHDPHWRGKYFSWQLTVGQYVYQINNQNPIMPIMNEIYTLFAGKDYLKLYQNRLVKLHLERNWGNGFWGGMDLSYEKRSILQNSTDYSFKYNHDPRITPNVPLEDYMMPEQNAVIASLNLNYQPGVHYIQYPDFKMPVAGNEPVFAVHYSEGITVGNATADFAKWRVSMLHHIYLRMAGNVDYKLAAGGFLWKKEVNFPDWNHINGNRTFLAGPFLNSFQLAPYYQFSNLANIYGEGHLEWHLDGLFSNKIPLFRRLNWYFVTGSNTLYIDRNDYYAEAFVGLEHIGFGLLRFSRVDFIAGYEARKSSPSLGIRIGFDGLFNDLIGIQSSKNL